MNAITPFFEFSGGVSHPLVSGPPQATEFHLGMLPCTECKSKVPCDACKKRYPKKAWPAQELKNQKKQGSKIVCAACRTKGVTARDLKLYTCQECRHLFGNKKAGFCTMTPIYHDNVSQFRYIAVCRAQMAPRLVGTGGYGRVLPADVFGAHVVGRARGPCCEMCSLPSWL